MIRTRFAPSPTGYLHIGGVRTALFNWLFARQAGGQFLLRIDDTDVGRNKPEALQPILDGFRWLGIDWDEGPDVGGPNGPYFQSQKPERYQDAVKVLLDKGLAYWDYSTPEELEAERKAGRERYKGKWRADSPEQRAAYEAEGRKGCVRLNMPTAGACEFRDHIRGDMVFQWVDEPDHIIQRSSGAVVYHLANVADDFDMKISHVIRAEEHLSNTPRQIFILQGLGYPMPEYAHLPFVAGPDGKKLSKRFIDKYLKNPEFKKIYEHGQRIAQRTGLAASAETFNPIITDFYREVGYLPHALINYLLLLGWSFDDKAEFFSRDEMIQAFTLTKVNKAPANFDPAKLLAFQEKYFKDLPVEQKLSMCLPYLEKAKVAATPSTVREILAAAGDRLKVAGDMLDYSDFFQADDQLQYEEAAVDKRLRKPPEAVPLLRKYRDHLAAAPAFDHAALEAQMAEFLATEGAPIGQIIHAVRVAVTGKTVGFGVFETLAILGKERSLRRIERALGMVTNEC